MAESLAKIEPKVLAEEAQKNGDAKRGAVLFYDKSNSCAKCHDPETGPRLGPDLAIKREGVTDQTLVEAVLDPSKEIHQDFKQVSVLTADGLVLKGFPVSENDDEYVIREPAGGQEIKIAQDDIEEVAPMKVSAMPAGLVNQMTDRAQFADLIKFLIEIQEGGPEAMQRLKK
jgi:putative heme-binding domain-containing protein